MSAGHRAPQTTFRALADPMRVRILNLLRQRRELFAGDLATTLGLHRNELNWHMKLLERAHLISTRRVGLQRQYRYTNEVTPFHDRLIDFLISVEHLLDASESESNESITDEERKADDSVGRDGHDLQ